ncbi:transposase [Xenorhabdus hominickii]|nr:transposase [Xenorhabdus hominickii]
MKEKVIDMAMNGSGVRDTGRVLGIGINTVIRTLKNSHQSR